MKQESCKSMYTSVQNKLEEVKNDTFFFRPFTSHELLLEVVLPIRRFQNVRCACTPKDHANVRFQNARFQNVR